MPELLTVSDVDRAGPQEAADVLAWVRTYLGTRNAEPELGRAYVCPFIPDAIKRNTLWFMVAPDISDAAETERLLLECAELFHNLDPTSGPDVRYKAIVAVFPSITADLASKAIDGVQARLKPRFVENLMMIGELHPWNRTPAKGLEAKGIWPNRTPVPCLAIRTIVYQDQKFLYDALSPGSDLSDNLRFWRYRRAWLRAMLQWGNPDWIERYRRLAEEDVQLATTAIDQLERLLSVEG